MFSSWHNPTQKKTDQGRNVSLEIHVNFVLYMWCYQPDAWDDWDDWDWDDSESQEKSIQHGKKWQTPYLFWDRASIGMVEQLLRMCVRVFKIRCAFFRNCLNWSLGLWSCIPGFCCSWCTRPEQRLDLRFWNWTFSFLAVLDFLVLCCGAAVILFCFLVIVWCLGEGYVEYLLKSSFSQGVIFVQNVPAVQICIHSLLHFFPIQL